MTHSADRPWEYYPLLTFHHGWLIPPIPDYGLTGLYLPRDDRALPGAGGIAGYSLFNGRSLSRLISQTKHIDSSRLTLTPVDLTLDGSRFNHGRSHIHTSTYDL